MTINSKVYRRMTVTTYPTNPCNEIFLDIEIPKRYEHYRQVFPSYFNYNVSREKLSDFIKELKNFYSNKISKFHIISEYVDKKFETSFTATVFIDSSLGKLHNSKFFVSEEDINICIVKNDSLRIIAKNDSLRIQKIKWDYFDRYPNVPETFPQPFLLHCPQKVKHLSGHSIQRN